MVTDGGLRDSPDIARMDFPAYAAAPSAPLNLVHHHAVDFNVPIGCGGVPVYPGDILVGDGEGVVVIPADLAEGVAQEAVAMTGYEDWAEAQVRAGRALPGLYPASEASRAEYAAWAERQPKIR
jgi:regulator of RNase E activity RraA